MNIYKSISKTVATAAIVLASYSSHGATLITEGITGSVIDGLFAGTVGTGTFTYDEDLLTLSGSETLTGTEFSLSFTIFGQTFTNSDDVDAPDFPELNFVDGMVTSLDFLVVDLLPTDIMQAGVDDFGFFDLTLAPGTGSKPPSFETIVSVNSALVPVPASIWLFASGIIGLIGVQRRKN